MRRLLREVERHPLVSEFVVNQVESRGLSRFVGSGTGARASLRRHFRLDLFVDGRRGRGHARVLLPAELDDLTALRRLLDRATERAMGDAGPPWALPSPTAPARVRVADPEIAADLRGALGGLEASVVAAGISSCELWATVAERRCVSSTGFDNIYRGTQIGARVRVGDARISMMARRVGDLGLEARIESARADAARPAVGRLSPGAYDLVVEGLGYGDCPEESVFAPLVALADARRYREGIGRIRLGHRLAPVGFSLRSDGTRDFGLFSRPFDDHGCGTRRFAIIERGVLSGLALGAREAALLGREPNGGLDNLAVECPTAAPAEVLEPRARDLLVVQEVAWVRGDPLVGGLELGVRAGRAISRDGSDARVGGFVVRAAGFDLFGASVGTEQRIELPWLQAPRALRLGIVGVA